MRDPVEEFADRARRRLYAMDDVPGELGGISRSKLYEEVASGRLKTVNIGRRRFVAADDLDAYVALLRSES